MRAEEGTEWWPVQCISRHPKKGRNFETRKKKIEGSYMYSIKTSRIEKFEDREEIHAEFFLVGEPIEREQFRKIKRSITTTPLLLVG